MTRAIALVLFLVAAPAAADSTTSTKPAKAPAAVTAIAPAKPTACKKVVVGKGLERRVICVIETEIDVTTSTPKPQVVIVHQSPRHVVGRPKSENRLNGLSQRRN